MDILVTAWWQQQAFENHVPQKITDGRHNNEMIQKRFGILINACSGC